MDNEITKEKLEKYFRIAAEAVDMVKSHPMDVDRLDMANDFLDMALRYISDAKHFFQKGDWVNAYGALNYAHGWLDAGARSRLFEVKDSRLFTVDDE